MSVNYYPVNEDLARRAKEMNSFQELAQYQEPMRDDVQRKKSQER